MDDGEDDNIDDNDDNDDSEGDDEPQPHTSPCQSSPICNPAKHVEREPGSGLGICLVMEGLKVFLGFKWWWEDAILSPGEGPCKEE